MSEHNKPSLRIDWFDGTVIEDSRSPNTSSSAFDDEDAAEPPPAKPQYSERKLMGFKRLFDLSQQDASNLTLQLSGRSSFWDLLNSELKDDFIVLITKIIAKLYASILLGQSTLMLKKLLKTKFLTSNFLNILTDYVIRLPSVRISEKRMNMQFWNDLEPFYDSVLEICDGILSVEEAQESAAALLEAVRASVHGVIEEHMEQFTEDLFIKMVTIESKVRTMGIKDSGKQSQATEAEQVIDKNNFRNLSIFPNKEDLLEEKLQDIRPNIINGAYSSVEHYLDVQFRLLREDCFGPLREGISKYMANTSKRRHENIRVHPRVRIIRSYVSNNRVGYLVDLAWSQRLAQTSVDCRQLANNKQLMFGSLLLFTSDNFESILCATVLDSSSNLLSEGYLAVSFHSPVSKRIFSEPYLMIESEVFFEPYHRVLKVLKNSKTNDIPMKRYIVDVQPETKAPKYLTPETMYNLVQGNEEIPFPVLDVQNWPSEATFGLDHSQMEAFKLALTREFAVIQGPPGTGKTFIGVKVANMLLQNLSLEGTPMLVICYTNHALDQFLEGILPVTKSVVRLGTQSKNKNIEPYTLNNLRAKSKSRYGYLYASKRDEQEKVFNEMTKIQTEIEKCERELLTFKTVKPYLKVGGKNVDLKTENEDPITKWLFGHLENEAEGENSNVQDDDELDDWEKQLDQFDDKVNIQNIKLDTCFSEQMALKEIDSMLNSVKYAKDVTDKECERQKIVDKFQMQIDKVKKRLECFKKHSQNGFQEVHREITEFQDPYKLTPDERWNAYFAAVNLIKDRLIADMNSLQEKHNTTTTELEEVGSLVDAEVLRRTRVVAATTSAAAARHTLLHNLRSPVVIVEEAAEVMEAHIVASLTHHCEHVILIGDHKQLRPTAAHYKLAKHFNLDVSLFERMIRNGVHARTLTTQRRMRPSFVQLIVPAVYERLDSHPSVYEYEDVRGMRENLFFFTHGVYEDEGLDNSWSHRNKHEAAWCAALASYLRGRGHPPADVTVLATYAGQASLIKEMSKKYSNLQDVKITVVDNYQGEESKIVILSLVRSNRDGKIGFLSAQNRICVALSRAKEGFYIFGNMGVLKSSSSIWSGINNTLLAQNAIGDHLALACDVHPENTLQVRTVDELEKCLTGSCSRICERKNQVSTT
ncbi:NFX1-type zinc finger-containing protein 1-like [Plutella xylostella]|uniref:NFX1-type zinc finger-containing protein 1-like n=1 Tax=Plutella xylostella TaxID=51655 RepID=UPI002032E160|nr:NFX1-type zinc finger-containing protein 1-like [Plutella xylostella]